MDSTTRWLSNNEAIVLPAVWIKQQKYSRDTEKGVLYITNFQNFPGKKPLPPPPPPLESIQCFNNFISTVIKYRTVTKPCDPGPSPSSPPSPFHQQQQQQQYYCCDNNNVLFTLFLHLS